MNDEIIEDLLNLCNEHFISPLVRQYAGSRNECMFCGATEQNDGSINHSASDCPVIKYQDLIEKHKHR